MISANEALQLKQAKLSIENTTQFGTVMRTIDRHIRKTMSFMGPTTLDIPYKDMSKEVSKLVCHVMKSYGWLVNANLFATEPRFAGGTPQLHHWSLQFQPTAEIYDELTDDLIFNRQITEHGEDENNDGSTAS